MAVPDPGKGENGPHLYRCLSAICMLIDYTLFLVFFGNAKQSQQMT